MSPPNPLSVAYSRFGLGPDPAGEWSHADARERVAAQIGASATEGLDPGLPSSGEAMRRHLAAEEAAKLKTAQRLAESRMMEMAASPAAAPTPAAPAPNTPAAPSAPPLPRPVSLGEELRFRLQRSLACPPALPERLVLFWADHFAIGPGKTTVALLSGAYEREALRPNIFSSFRALLSAAVTHPAMLVFLDNEHSFGPNSRIGKQKSRGLNENLAREVLELHTLGSAGGYTQTDVTTLAAVLSGWVIQTNQRSDKYGQGVFEAQRHEPGAKTIMGKTYPDLGPRQLQLVLDDLARHPATAQHVATRLCRAFLSETPPPALVARVARKFRDTDGDLKEVVRVLVLSDEAWAEPARKVRPPIELLYIVSRLLGAVPDKPAPDAALRAMGQPYLGAPSPKGWPDEDDAWATGDGIKTRLDWAQGIGARFGPKVDVRHLLDGPLAGCISDETRTTVLQAERQEQALALLIMSPELQRR